MSSKVRVRFAPSPTGPLHIGGVRTALYNYLFAKKAGGTFILRIEDTDQTRYVEGAEQYIKDALEWCGLDLQEGPNLGGDFGPYRQSERKEQYKQYAMQLVESGHAYYAFDTPEELEEMRENLRKQGVASPQYNQATRTYMKNSLTLSEDDVKAKLEAGEPYVIRINVPRKEEVKLDDMIRGWVSWHSKQLDDKVLFKADGMPTYHLANVVDDHLMEISHIIRGEEWLPSTPIHVLLYRFLGWEMPKFAHLPLILRPDGNGKLSKRDGDKLGFPVFPLDWTDPAGKDNASGFRELGFFPEAFLNMLAFLGWNPGTQQEVFHLDDLIETFSMDRVGKAGAKFDFQKAKWFNQQHIKDKSNKELAELFTPTLKENGISAENSYIETVCGLLKERVEFIPDFWEMGKAFFQDEYPLDESVIQKRWKPEIYPVINELIEKLNALEPFEAEAIEEIVKGLLDKYEIGFGNVLPIFRVMITGEKSGPPIYEVAALIGKEKCLSRMKNTRNNFEQITQKV